MRPRSTSPTPRPAPPARIPPPGPPAQRRSRSRRSPGRTLLLALPAGLVQSSSLFELVGGLQGLRGVSVIAAATLAAEFGDLSRFETALRVIPAERLPKLFRETFWKSSLGGGVTSP